MLIAVACVAGAAWYVPRVMSDDHKLLTGTVTSSGVVTLNFTYPGEISKVESAPTQSSVREGQVLAAEYDPDAATVVAADKAAIAAVWQKIAELKAAEAVDWLAVPADNAQIAAGEGADSRGPGSAGNRSREDRCDADSRTVIRSGRRL